MFLYISYGNAQDLDLSQTIMLSLKIWGKKVSEFVYIALCEFV